jgi:hypothetical protein
MGGGKRAEYLDGERQPPCQTKIADDKLPAERLETRGEFLAVGPLLRSVAVRPIVWRNRRRHLRAGSFLRTGGHTTR